MATPSPDIDVDADPASLDADDPLAAYREQFRGSEALYMDGNSLGLASDRAVVALEAAVDEWCELAIQGYTEADPPWFYYGEALGEALAPLLGTDPDSVVVGNSTTVNIHQLLASFYEPDDRPVVVVDELNFPTDTYAVRSQMRLRGVDPEDSLRVVESRDGQTIDADDVVAAIDESVGIVWLPSVLYRSGQLLDVERVTAAAHDHGALVGWDLAHSVGVVPHQLDAVGVDFAAWCSYKYLNGGPGAIAGLYVNERHHGTDPGLAGWWGHEKETQFELRDRFTPAPDAGAYQIGSIPIFSAATLHGSIATIREAGIEAIRTKSLELTAYLMALVDELEAAGYAYRVGTPREPARRGGHVAVEHPDAVRISQALRDRGVIVDYRPPNVIRVCPSPLYTSFDDVAAVRNELAAVVDEGAYESFDSDPAGVT